MCRKKLKPFKGASGAVKISRLDKQTITSKFESHWAPNFHALVLHFLHEIHLQNKIKNMIKMKKS